MSTGQHDRCEACGAPAVFVAWRGEAGRERPLCESCLTPAIDSAHWPNACPVGRFVGLLVRIRPPGPRSEVRPLRADLTCRGCGLTYAELAEAGMPGCPRCYETFREAMLPALAALHDPRARTETTI
ncbi:MAG: hypothetical protein IT208_13360 [Chthonomonadales bacterium]|nr:hypothetical protein [Chthonomonadales bacterium]